MKRKDLINYADELLEDAEINVSSKIITLAEKYYDEYLMNDEDWEDDKGEYDKPHLYEKTARDSLREQDDWQDFIDANFDALGPSIWDFPDYDNRMELTDAGKQYIEGLAGTLEYEDVADLLGEYHCTRLADLLDNAATVEILGFLYSLLEMTDADTMDDRIRDFTDNPHYLQFKKDFTGRELLEDIVEDSFKTFADDIIERKEYFEEHKSYEDL